VSAELLFVDRVVNLVEEGIDVAVRIGHLPDSSLVAVPVGKIRRVICASPEYLRRRGIPRVPQDVRDHACVRLTGLAPRPEWQFRIGRRAITVALNVVISCNDTDSGLQACVGGHGLGLFLSYQTAPYRNEKRLRYVLEEFEPEQSPVHVVYAQSRLVTGKVRSFVDECVATLRGARFD
jgi:DNA-binding transcriptional LysR family regulator